jgi:hypothetical protein
MGYSSSCDIGHPNVVGSFATAGFAPHVSLLPCVASTNVDVSSTIERACDDRHILKSSTSVVASVAKPLPAEGSFGPGTKSARNTGLGSCGLSSVGRAISSSRRSLGVAFGAGELGGELGIAGDGAGRAAQIAGGHATTAAVHQQGDDRPAFGLIEDGRSAAIGFGGLVGHSAAS